MYQRAYVYSPRINYKIDNWYWSNKYDGFRVYYSVTKDSLCYRTGREILRLNNILESCREICQRDGLELLDGELWIPGLKFREISSLVRGQKSVTDEQKESIKFVLFAARKPDGEEDFTTTEMINYLDSLDYSAYPNFVKVKYDTVENNTAAIDAIARQEQDKGWEGIMLRHPEISYVAGGTRTLLKRVIPKESIYKIIGFTEGNGRYSGMLGSLIYEGTAVDENKNDILVEGKVSSGLKIQQRHEIWSNKEDYLGVAVRLRYQKVNSPDEDGKGALRFPRLLEIVQNCKLVQADDLD